MKLLAHGEYLCSALADTAKQFYKVVTLFYNLTNSISESQLLCIYIVT